MTTLKPMPNSCTDHCGRFIALTLLIGCLLPLGVQAAQDPQSVLTLYQTVENGSELSCSETVPGPGTNTTAWFFPRDPERCQGNEQDEEDKVFKPHSIRIRNAPAAAKFILSDTKTNQHRCSQEQGSNWIELETTSPLAALEKMGLDKITDYPPGYIYNLGSDTAEGAPRAARSKGFKLVAFQGVIDQGKLNCIEITTSAGESSGGK